MRIAIHGKEIQVADTAQVARWVNVENGTWEPYTYDIFDRFLISKHFKNYSTTIDFCVCLYISIKYFNNQNNISYFDLLPKDCKTIKLMKYAEYLEEKIISEVLNYTIYRKNVYEIATDYLDDLRVRNLLMVYAERTDYSGKKPSEIYQMLRDDIIEGVYIKK